MVECSSVLCIECLFGERDMRVKTEVAERMVAFLGRLLHLYGSHHPGIISLGNVPLWL